MMSEINRHLQHLISQAILHIHKDIHLIQTINHTIMAKHPHSIQVTQLNLQTTTTLHIILANHQTTHPTIPTQHLSAHIKPMTHFTLPQKRKNSVMKSTKFMIFVISFLCILHNATKDNLHHHPMQIAYLNLSTKNKFPTTLTFFLVASFSKNKSST